MPSGGFSLYQIGMRGGACTNDEERRDRPVGGEEIEDLLRGRSRTVIKGECHDALARGCGRVR